MNNDPKTLANFGFSFYDDELKECDLKNLANRKIHRLPSIITISLVDSPADKEVVETNGDALNKQVRPKEITCVDSTSMKESASSGYKELRLIIDQYNKQQDRSTSTASLESTETSCIKSCDNPTLETKTEASSSSTSDSIPKKKKCGRKPVIPRGDDVIPGEFFCEKCKRNFLSARGLKQHITAHHTGTKAHGCDICGKRFDLQEKMLQHRERHSAENKPLECGIGGCTRRFMYRTDMERHVAVRHGKARHCCEICGKGFGRKDHLEKHGTSHKFNRVVSVIRSI